MNDYDAIGCSLQEHCAYRKPTLITMKRCYSVGPHWLVYDIITYEQSLRTWLRVSLFMCTFSPGNIPNSDASTETSFVFLFRFFLCRLIAFAINRLRLRRSFLLLKIDVFSHRNRAASIFYMRMSKADTRTHKKPNPSVTTLNRKYWSFEAC